MVSSRSASTTSPSLGIDHLVGAGLAAGVEFRAAMSTAITRAFAHFAIINWWMPMPPPAPITATVSPPLIVGAAQHLVAASPAHR